MFGAKNACEMGVENEKIRVTAKNRIGISANQLAFFLLFFLLLNLSFDDHSENFIDRNNNIEGGRKKERNEI